MLNDLLHFEQEEEEHDGVAEELRLDEQAATDAFDDDEIAEAKRGPLGPYLNTEEVERLSAAALSAALTASLRVTAAERPSFIAQHLIGNAGICRLLAEQHAGFVVGVDFG